MSRFRICRQAHTDLEDIWLHIASDNLTAADRFVDELFDKFKLLASEPGMGRRREDLANALRSFPVGNYIIFYITIAVGIEIARVLSGFRDLPNVLADEQ